MTALITGHSFRTSASASSTATGEKGGIAKGMCAWLGTCNRPREEHASQRGKTREKT